MTEPTTTDPPVPEAPKPEVAAGSLTDALYKRADQELRAYLHKQLNPIFEECRNSNVLHSKRAATDPDWKEFKDDAWIGNAWRRFEGLAFLYLRDKWREKAVADFIAKVEAVDELRGQLEAR